jgi:hypothetical protein
MNGRGNVVEFSRCDDSRSPRASTFPVAARPIFRRASLREMVLGNFPKTLLLPRVAVADYYYISERAITVCDKDLRLVAD